LAADRIAAAQSMMEWPWTEQCWDTGRTLGRTRKRQATSILFRIILNRKKGNGTKLNNPGNCENLGKKTNHTMPKGNREEARRGMRHTSTALFFYRASKKNVRKPTAKFLN
jgi:hypothetical protein